MLEKFIKQYPLFRTLRFELKPVGETADYLEDFKSAYLKSVVDQDKKRSENYQEIKKLIDDYHRGYIKKRLTHPVDLKTGKALFTSQDFEEAFCCYQKFKKARSAAKKAWQNNQERLRKKLVRAFADKKSLFGENLIKKTLPDWLQKKGEWNENRKIVESFNQFTTYFTGFHQNRKNMYVSDDKSTAIAYRVMNENLPRFFENCALFSRTVSQYPDLNLQVEGQLLDRMGASKIDEIFQPGYFLNLFTQEGIDDFQELLGGRTDETQTLTGINQQINLYRQQHTIKNRNLPNFIPLCKQILSDRVSRSFLPDSFDTDGKLLTALREFVKESHKLITDLEKSVAGLCDADLSRTFVKNDKALRNLSHSLFQNYFVIPDAISHHAENVACPAPSNGKVSQKLAKKRETFCKQAVFNLADLDSWVVSYINTLDQDDQQRHTPEKPVSGCFISQLKQAKKDVKNALKETKPLFDLDELSKKRRPPKDDNDTGDKGFQQVSAIHNLLNKYLALDHSVRPLYLSKDRKPLDIPDVDMGFYASFPKNYETYNRLLLDLYNKARNHLTKKTFSKDKIKLNFDNSQLLKG